MKKAKQIVAYKLTSSWDSIVCAPEFVYSTRANVTLLRIEMDFNWVRAAMEANYIR